MSDYCNFCGGTELALLYRAPPFDSPLLPPTDDLGIARCKSCALVNTTGVRHEEVAATYTSEYYGSASSKFLSAIERALSLTRLMHARKILRIWRGEDTSGHSPSVLDIGCGRGQLLQAFQSLGATVLGLEREEFPVHQLSGDIVRTGSITDPEYSESKFDIIILWHVLEHLERLDELLDSITGHLNDQGILIIAVPNFSSLQQQVFTRYWFHLDLPRHLVHIESTWLENLLVSRGYRIDATNYLDMLQNTYGFIQSGLNAMAPRRMNNYYRLLKHGLSLHARRLLRMVAWTVPAMLLLPFAIGESLIGALTRRGATVQIAARRNSSL